MTPYTDRRNAGHYDPPGAKKKTAAEKNTTSDKLAGVTKTKASKTSK